MNYKIGSLFSGYGGLDLAVEQHFNAETVWHAEWEDAPSAVLSHHWPDIPNYRDVSAIDWNNIEQVDIITGGFPCQDVSTAGRRAGMTEGTRSNLWGAMRTAIETMRPRYVVAENVKGLLSATATSNSDMEPEPGSLGDDSTINLRALGRVLGDLADLGYDAQWHGLRAADIGAPHNRFRVFILAWDPEQVNANTEHNGQPASQNRQSDGTTAQARPRLRSITPEHDGQPARGHSADCGSGPVSGSETATNASSQRRAGQRCTGEHEAAHSALTSDKRDPQTGGSAAANTIDSGCISRPVRIQPPHIRAADARLRDTSRAREPETDDTGPAWGAYEPAIRRWESLHGTAPHPTEPTGQNGRAQLSAKFTEWIMGLPAGWVTEVPGVSRANQIKMLGNGVVPPQALRALQVMTERRGADDQLHE